MEDHQLHAEKKRGRLVGAVRVESWKKLGKREKGPLSYLFRGKLPLVVLIDQAFVQQRHQSIGIDMWRKVKLPVRLVDPPFLLQLGGRLAVICDGQSARLTLLPKPW